MKKSKQPIKSKIAEHEKFRRQCKVRIRPSLILTALLTIVLGWVGIRLNDGWKVAIPILAISYFYTAMEIISYFRHDIAIKNLTESEKSAPNRKIHRPVISRPVEQRDQKEEEWRNEK